MSLLPTSRREFLKMPGTVAGAGVLGRPIPFCQSKLLLRSAYQAAESKADYTLRIRASAVDIGGKHIVSATTYNGQFPGPMLRFKEGQPVTVDVHNDTDTPEQLHWHGQMVPTDVDGAAEEGTPYIPAHGTRRIAFTPRPVWILGDLANDDRGHGMGIVLEYAGRTGKAQWITPPVFKWNYARFAKSGATAPPADETFEMTFAKDNAAEEGFNRWTINGVAYPMTSELAPATFHLKQGKRYRLRMRNASDDIHPIHLHRHSFERTSLAGKSTSGVLNDVVMLGGFQEAEVDFVADNPGLTLFHCHQQLHMDFGFMTLFDYV